METAKSRCWRYHATQEPRIFEEGETIPQGWVDSPAKVTGEQPAKRRGRPPKNKDT